MKPLLILLAAITFIGCSSQKEISNTHNQNPETGQVIHKSYGPGGKIIYGNAQDSVNTENSITKEKSIPVRNIKPQNESTSAAKYKLKKIRKKKKIFKSPILGGYKFRKAKINNSHTSKTPPKSSADGAAVAGLTLSLISVGLFFATILAFAAAGLYGAGIGVAILALAWIISLAMGAIFSLIGLESQNKKGAAIAGTIISGVFIFFLIYVFVVGI